MKEYNIYVKTPPIGNVFIYMLGYHSYLHLSELGILLDAAAEISAMYYIAAGKTEIGIHSHLNRMFGRKYTNFTSALLGIDAGGVLYRPIETDSGDILTTRTGVEIISVYKKLKTLPVSAQKFFDTSNTKFELGAGSIDSKAIQTRNGSDIQTRDGVGIDNVYKTLKTVTFTEYKRTTPSKESIAFENHINQSALLRLFDRIDNTFKVETKGYVYESLWARNGDALLTRDGNVIDSRYITDLLKTYLTKRFSTSAAQIRVDAGGTAYHNLLTRSGDQLTTDNGTEIEAVEKGGKELQSLLHKTIPSVPYDIGIESVANQTALLKINETFKSEVSLPISGICYDTLHTRDGNTLITDSGQAIETRFVSDAVSIYERKAFPVDDAMELKVEGIRYDSLAARTDEDILTQDGQEIETRMISESLPTYKRQYTRSDGFNVELHSGGMIYDYLLTRSGDQLTTDNGAEIEYVYIENDLPIYQKKRFSVDGPCDFSINAGGVDGNTLSVSKIEVAKPEESEINLEVTYDDVPQKSTYFEVDPGVDIGFRGSTFDTLMSSDGEEILSNDGTEIETIYRTDTLTLYQKKVFHVDEGKLSTEAGGVVYSFLETRDAESLITSSGEVIEAYYHSDEVPLNYRHLVVPTETSIIPSVNAAFNLALSRKLADVDGSGLGDIDNMTLHDLDYIEI